MFHKPCVALAFLHFLSIFACFHLTMFWILKFILSSAISLLFIVCCSFGWVCPAQNRHKLNEGNALFNFTLDIARLCYKYGIPLVIENPLTSIAWEVPSMQQFIQRPGVHICDLDFCQFGERWKKPTRLVYFALDLKLLCKTCQGSHHKCSQSKRPHIALIGRDSSGTWWTRRAQPYPFALVDAFAVLALQQLSGA